ncbi:hypothetical protein SKAU_G00155370 [Synaphobranchus kaupii]|uniref:Uncharacterized protein n=1 Tax=Synaphobranchus kaupii TaxID=118154 RepID=A0A9Q1IZD0_SYNKA|nr:hypothetical protein SKAU_G00155370 [Synaphobranchus kaupii]
MGFCRTLVSSFSQSWLKKRKLSRVQAELQIPQHSLILDIAVLESVNAALKPASDFTDVLSGENYVTLSSVKPILQLLTGDVLGPSEEDTILMSDIKVKMCQVLKQKYEAAALQKLLAKACLLDPRYRGNHVEDLEEIKEELLEEMQGVAEE